MKKQTQEEWIAIVDTLLEKNKALGAKVDELSHEYLTLSRENEKLVKLLGEYLILADSVVAQEYHIELLGMENKTNWFDRRDELRSEI